MRPRRLAAAVALLAALALVACTGGGPPPAATPEATSATEAPSTPAPTAEASPTPAPAPDPTPEPPPEQACANGVAVAEPEVRPGLVADCVALLASRDALRGEASLDWGGDLAIGRWEGVAVEGEPPRVTRLDLSDKGLTGAIPRGLGEMERLSTLILADNALTGGIPRPIGRLPLLREVRLAGNALTGCVPSAFGDARGDALYLGLPWCLRYDRLDATGEVAEAGGWAILGADGEVLATWEGLRSEAATLRVHQTDAGGTSWAPEFGAVSEGDLFEWRKASDCWVRYLVTGPPVRPASGSMRWEFPVKWMTYAATGEGCTGAVGASAVLGADEEPAPVRLAVDTPSIETPVRHGPWLLIPRDWAGAIEPYVPIAATPPSGASGAAGPSDGGQGAPSWPSGDPDEVRRHPLWSVPDLPDGWRLGRVLAQDDTSIEAIYLNEDGYIALSVWIWTTIGHPRHVESLCCNTDEVRIIDGRPALVWYDPGADSRQGADVRIYYEPTHTMYIASMYDARFRHDVPIVIGIARSLLPTDGTP